LIQQFQVIEVNMYSCTNATEAAYVKQSALIYDALDTCLQYGVPATYPPDTTDATTTTQL